MKKTNYTISKKMMSVEIMKQAEMLKKYGIDKPSEFEIAQLKRFGLTEHLHGVVATQTGIVLCNWHLVLAARMTGIKELEVINIDNLTEDEIPQVIAVKNIRKKLSKKNLASLIVEYRDYLTLNETGKSWAEEIPGDSIDAKIGELLDYSYGMINGYQSIHKHNPDFLKMMDEGQMSYTQAIQAIKDEKSCDPVTENRLYNNSGWLLEVALFYFRAFKQAVMQSNVLKCIKRVGE